MSADSPRTQRIGRRGRLILALTSATALGFVAWASLFTNLIQVFHPAQPTPAHVSSSHDTITIVPPFGSTAPASQPPAVSPPSPPGASQPKTSDPGGSAPAPVAGPSRDFKGVEAAQGRPASPPSGIDWWTPSNGAIEERRPTTSFLLASASYGPQCVPHVSAYYGVAGGTVTDSLTKPGNPNCVQANYGDMMSIVVQQCGGETTDISQIEVTRAAFKADGRMIPYPASLSYSLIVNGQETLPLPLGTGGYNRVQRAEFPPARASAVRVIIRSPRTYGYPIYQRICSIVVR
jgi:hypothetical protein